MLLLSLIGLALDEGNINLLQRSVFPQLSGLQVDFLLFLPGFPLLGIVDFAKRCNVGESGDAVDAASAEVDGRGALAEFTTLECFDGRQFVVLGDDPVALRDEVFGDAGGEEGLGPLGRGHVIEVGFDEGVEGGDEVLIEAVVEGVEGFGALDVFGLSIVLLKKVGKTAGLGRLLCEWHGKEKSNIMVLRCNMDKNKLK